MEKKELQTRTFEFAQRCIKLSVTLPKNKLGNHIKGQLIRCSSSMAANYHAALVVQLKPSYTAKLSIVIEEADKISLLVRTGYR